MRGFRPWTVQPPAGTPIDWDNPLAQGLFFCYQGAESHELTTGSRPTLLGTLASPLLVPTGTGLSIDWNATSSMAYTAYQDGPTVNTVTVLCYAQMVGKPVDSAILIGKGYNNTAVDVSYGLMWNLNGSQGTNSVATVIMDGGTRKFTASAVAPIALTTPSVLIGTYDQTYLRNFQNGIEYGTPTALTVVPKQYTGAGNSMMVSGYSDASATVEWAGNIFMGAVWSRALNPAEIADISANPWQVFHRRRRAYSLITGSTISASISESVTSADSYALSATAAAAISEAATSADAYATSATIFATLTETIAPSDAYAIAVAVAAALDSSAAASSALTAVATIAATIAEVSTAQDTLGVTATVLAAIAEAATATDTQATGSVTSAAYADSATAAAIFNATVSIAATLTEAGLAADQIAAMATVAADLAESGAAADAYLSSVLLAVELLENAAAADELSATAFEQIIDAAKTIITIVQARDTVTLVQAQDTVTMVQARDTLRILQ